MIDGPTRYVMHTAYDWVTLAIFCGLVTLFLQRSTGPAVAGDHILRYVPPALGCAVANAFGNRGQDIAAIPLIIATVGYVIYVLRPLRGWD